MPKARAALSAAACLSCFLIYDYWKMKINCSVALTSKLKLHWHSQFPSTASALSRNCLVVMAVDVVLLKFFQQENYMIHGDACMCANNQLSTAGIVLVNHSKCLEIKPSDTRFRAKMNLNCHSLTGILTVRGYMPVSTKAVSGPHHCVGISIFFYAIHGGSIHLCSFALLS